MKKGLLALAMILVFGLTANVALTDETVVYPFFQHGWGCTTFWSVANDGAAPAVVTINMLLEDGSLHDSTTATVEAGEAWLPDTGNWQPWYTKGNALGFGNFVIDSDEDAIYLWACIYGAVPGILGSDGQAGYTLVLPQNPYGN